VKKFLLGKYISIYYNYYNNLFLYWLFKKYFTPNRLSDASGKMEFKEEARNKISLSMLDSDDVFVVDVQCESNLYIYKLKK